MFSGLKSRWTIPLLCAWKLRKREWRTAADREANLGWLAQRAVRLSREYSKDAVDLAEDFDKVLRVALAVKPDKILFAALEGDKNRAIEEDMQRLRAQLASLEVDARWYGLHGWVNEAWSVR